MTIAEVRDYMEPNTACWPATILNHHSKILRNRKVYISGFTDDSLLVRCWISEIQIEVNVNPSLLKIGHE